MHSDFSDQLKPKPSLTIGSAKNQRLDDLFPDHVGNFGVPWQPSLMLLAVSECPLRRWSDLRPDFLKERGV